ncbi:MAG: signal peptidase I [Clostridiales bacterium]|nr:signal peptidase I [Clostridiales bacterium]
MRRREDYIIEFDYEESEPQQKPPCRFWLYVYDFFGSISGALFTVFIVFTFLFRMVDVDGDSMLNTLSDGDWLCISSLYFEPEYGDIVIISRENTNEPPIVKRIIGKENDVIDIDFHNNTVSVNGKILDEPYVSTPTQRSFDVSFPLTVPENCVFVLGDNRNHSLDSRSSLVGCVDENRILGKVLVRLTPEITFFIGQKGH